MQSKFSCNEFLMTSQIVLRIRSIMRDSIYDLFPKYHKYVTNFDLGRVQDEIDHEIVGTPIYTSSGGTTESVMK